MTILLILLLLIQLFYWHYFFKNLTRKACSQVNNPQRSVSLIVCVKNEIENLRRHLGQLMAQNHMKYELIIADDFSSDKTSEFVKKIDNERGILKFYEVKQNKRGKKQALKEAIGISEHNWVLLTDADCSPSPEWMNSMTQRITSDKIKIVLGYSPSQITEGYLSRWVHFETWITALQYLSFATRGLPYMGVGRNLLYDKTMLASDTLDKFDQLSSGDDDLTIMQIATSENTAINLDPNSYVYTSAPAKFMTYWKQKTRHYSTASSYKASHIALLSAYSLSHVFFYLLISIMLMRGHFIVAVSLYLLRMCGILPVVQQLKTKLTAEFSLLSFLVFDLLQSLYYLIFSFAVLFPQKHKW